MSARRSFLLVGLLLGCSRTIYHPELQPNRAPTTYNRPLKVHTLAGDLHVLTSWREEGDSVLVGLGQSFDATRSPTTGAASELRIPIASIAVLETEASQKIGPIGLTLLPVWVVLTTAVTAICVADPKSCFGSCPTFYAAGRDGGRPEAEGFSASITRSLEARDLDALPRVHPVDGTVRLLMRNEALETHAVRSVELLAIPRPEGARVFSSPSGTFHPAASLIPPVRCLANEGSCLTEVAAEDGLERRSTTDPNDLGMLETVTLEFHPQTTVANAGVVLSARQSFVSTYLLYQAMAYAGSRAADWLVAIERGGEGAMGAGFEATRIVGRIEVSLDRGDGWESVGQLGEPGPLATDVQVLPVGEVEAGRTLKVRLTLAQGAWRIDQVALAALGDPVMPIVFHPSQVERSNQRDSVALARLQDPTRYLVTYPGDDYWIEWQLPAGLTQVELFLASTGYYYEWMRPEWVSEENPTMMALLVRDPQEALRRMAPGFKTLEPRIDALFWSSRFHTRR